MPISLTRRATSRVNALDVYDDQVDPLVIAAGVITTLIAASIVTLSKVGADRLRSWKARAEAQAAPAYPVRLICRDETEFDPESGYHEFLYFEIFNHSNRTVRVKGFGLRIAMTGPHDQWNEYIQAHQHPLINFPARLRPNDGIEGYMDHEAVGDEMHERGLFDYAGHATPYVDVVGYGEHTAEVTKAAASG